MFEFLDYYFLPLLYFFKNVSENINYSLIWKNIPEHQAAQLTGEKHFRSKIWTLFKQNKMKHQPLHTT